MNSYKYKLGFIGCGNMARAIIDGVLKSGLLKEEQIVVSRKSGHDCGFDIMCTTDNSFVAQNSEFVVLAVKPQIFNEISLNTTARCVISIMAGIESKTISDKLGAKVIRVMPNTPSKIGMGATAIAFNDCDEECNEFCNKIFESVGCVCSLDENLFDAVTCVSGSGPAYAYYFANSMIDGGVANGLDEKLSRQLALDTIIGACEMIKAQPEVDINELISNVCSKGGTTIEAIKVFDSLGLHDAVVKGMTACKNRSRELREKK